MSGIFYFNQVTVIIILFASKIYIPSSSFFLFVVICKDILILTAQFNKSSEPRNEDYLINRSTKRMSGLINRSNCIVVRGGSICKQKFTSFKKIICLQEQEDDFSFGGVGDGSTQVGLVASSVDGKNNHGSPGKFHQ